MTARPVLISLWAFALCEMAHMKLMEAAHEQRRGRSSIEPRPGKVGKFP
jgi:hypothetical protein